MSLLAAQLWCALLAQAAPVGPPQRVLVYHLEAPDLADRQRGVLTSTLISELRGLQSFTPVSAGRARHQPTLGDPEHRRTCLPSLACLRHAMDAIGADILLHGWVRAEDGGWRVFLERLGRDGSRTGVERVAAATPGTQPGDETLAVVGPMIAELFGGGAGTPKILVPVRSAYTHTWLLPPWIFGVGAALSIGAMAGAVVTAAEMSSAESHFNQLTTGRDVVDGAVLAQLSREVSDLADATNVLLWSAGGLVATTLALAFFTDFGLPLDIGVGVAPPAVGPAGLQAHVAGRF